MYMKSFHHGCDLAAVCTVLALQIETKRNPSPHLAISLSCIEQKLASHETEVFLLKVDSRGGLAFSVECCGQT